MHLDHFTRKETLPEQAKRLGAIDIDFILVPKEKTADDGNESTPISWEYIGAGCDDAIKCFHDLIERLLKWQN